MSVEKKTKKAIASQIATADSIFHSMPSIATATRTAKLMFIAPSKNGVRLIVQRSGQATTDAVYAFPELLEYADVKIGDTITMLVEKRIKDTKEYWNVTALSKVE